MINENILINRRKWIIEKIDQYLEGKITREELQKWAFQQREWEPGIVKPPIDNNSSDVSDILDLLCYVLNEPIEIGMTDEELIGQKKHLERIEEIFKKDILPRIEKLEGYDVKGRRDHLSFLILYSKNNEKFLEKIIYKDLKPIHTDQTILKKRDGDSKLPFDELGEKYNELKEGIIDRESYTEFVLKLLENENMKKWYSVILNFLGYMDNKEV